MKKLILIVLIVISASAGEYCSTIEKLATVIMEVRQVGLPAISAYEMAKGDKLAQTIVKDAYSQPAFTLKEFQDRAVRDFADKYYISCIKNIGGK